MPATGRGQFKATLNYLVSSRTARAVTHRSPVLKNQPTNQINKQILSLLSKISVNNILIIINQIMTICINTTSSNCRDYY